jgi:hypothetical protein
MAPDLTGLPTSVKNAVNALTKENGFTPDGRFRSATVSTITVSSSGGEVYLSVRIGPYTDYSGRDGYADFLFVLSQEQFGRIEPALRDRPQLIYEAVFRQLAAAGKSNAALKTRIDELSKDLAKRALFAKGGDMVVEPVVIDANGVVATNGAGISPIPASIKAADIDRLKERLTRLAAEKKDLKRSVERVSAEAAKPAAPAPAAHAKGVGEEFILQSIAFWNSRDVRELFDEQLNMARDKLSTSIDSPQGNGSRGADLEKVTNELFRRKARAEAAAAAQAAKDEEARRAAEVPATEEELNQFMLTAINQLLPVNGAEEIDKLEDFNMLDAEIRMRILNSIVDFTTEDMARPEDSEQAPFYPGDRRGVLSAARDYSEKMLAEEYSIGVIANDLRVFLSAKGVTLTDANLRALAVRILEAQKAAGGMKAPELVLSAEELDAMGMSKLSGISPDALGKALGRMGMEGVAGPAGRVEGTAAKQAAPAPAGAAAGVQAPATAAAPAAAQQLAVEGVIKAAMRKADASKNFEEVAAALHALENAIATARSAGIDTSEVENKFEETKKIYFALLKSEDAKSYITTEVMDTIERLLNEADPVSAPAIIAALRAVQKGKAAELGKRTAKDVLDNLLRADEPFGFLATADPKTDIVYCQKMALVALKTLAEKAKNGDVGAANALKALAKHIAFIASHELIHCAIVKDAPAYDAARQEILTNHRAVLKEFIRMLVQNEGSVYRDQFNNEGAKTPGWENITAWDEANIDAAVDRILNTETSADSAIGEFLAGHPFTDVYKDVRKALLNKHFGKSLKGPADVSISLITDRAARLAIASEMKSAAAPAVLAANDGVTLTKGKDTVDVYFTDRQTVDSRASLSGVAAPNGIFRFEIEEKGGRKRTILLVARELRADPALLGRLGFDASDSGLKAVPIQGADVGMIVAQATIAAVNAEKKGMAGKKAAEEAEGQLAAAARPAAAATGPAPAAPAATVNIADVKESAQKKIDRLNAMKNAVEEAVAGGGTTEFDANEYLDLTGRLKVEFADAIAKGADEKDLAELQEDADRLHSFAMKIMADGVAWMSSAVRGAIDAQADDAIVTLAAKLDERDIKIKVTAARARAYVSQMNTAIERAVTGTIGQTVSSVAEARNEYAGGVIGRFAGWLRDRVSAEKPGLIGRMMARLADRLELAATSGGLNWLKAITGGSSLAGKFDESLAAGKLEWVRVLLNEARRQNDREAVTRLEALESIAGGLNNVALALYRYDQKAAGWSAFQRKLAEWFRFRDLVKSRFISRAGLKGKDVSFESLKDISAELLGSAALTMADADNLKSAIDHACQRVSNAAYAFDRRAIGKGKGEIYISLEDKVNRTLESNRVFKGLLQGLREKGLAQTEAAEAACDELMSYLEGAEEIEVSRDDGTPINETGPPRLDSQKFSVLSERFKREIHNAILGKADNPALYANGAEEKLARFIDGLAGEDGRPVNLNSAGKDQVAAILEKILPRLGITSKEDKDSVLELVLEASPAERSKKLAGYIVMLGLTSGVDGKGARKFYAGSDAAFASAGIDAIIGGARKVFAELVGQYESFKDKLPEKGKLHPTTATARDLDPYYRIAAIGQIATALSFGNLAYPEQMLTGIFMDMGYFVDMATGSGKTQSFPFQNLIAPLRGLKAIHGVSAHYYTSRDHLETKFTYRLLGRRTAAITEKDSHDLPGSMKRLENNDVIFMSFGALQTLHISAIGQGKEAQRELEAIFDVCHLTLDECDLTIRLADMIISGTQKALSSERFMKESIYLYAAKYLKESGAIDKLVSVLQKSFAEIGAGNVDAVKSEFGLDRLELSNDGKTLTVAAKGKTEVLTAQAARDGVQIETASGRVRIRNMAGRGETPRFAIRRMENKGKVIDGAEGFRFQIMPDGQVKFAGKAARDKASELLEGARKALMAAHNIKIEEIDPDRLCAYIKGLYAEKEGVNYILKYEEKIPDGKSITMKDGSVGGVIDGVKADYKDGVYAIDGAYVKDQNGREEPIAGASDKLFEGRTSTERLIYVRPAGADPSVEGKPYMLKREGPGEFKLVECDLQIVLLDELTGREQKGQRRDVYHTIYEMKHYGEQGGSMTVKGDNESVELTTFPIIARMMRSVSGASGSVATVGPAMVKVFRSRGIVSMDAHFENKRTEEPELMTVGEGLNMKGALSDVGDIMMLHPGASVLFYVEGRSAAEELAKGDMKERIDALARSLGCRADIKVFNNEEVEVDLVRAAGRLGTITITTGMLGRATDVSLAVKAGFNPRAAKEELGRVLAKTGLASDAIEEAKGDLGNMLLDLFFMTNPSDRQKQKDVIRNFLASHKIGRSDKLYKMIEQKYFNGLFIVNTTTSANDQVKVQLNGRTGRNGDAGGVITRLDAGDDGDAWKLMQEVFDPDTDAHKAEWKGDGRKQRWGRSKFAAAKKARDEVERLQKLVLDGDGRFRPGLSPGLRAQWAKAQFELRKILKEARDAFQAEKDREVMNKVEADEATFKEMQRFRDYEDESYDLAVIDGVLEHYLGDRDIGKLKDEDTLNERIARAIGNIEVNLGFPLDVNFGSEGVGNLRDLKALRGKLRAAIVHVLEGVGKFRAGGRVESVRVGGQSWDLSFIDGRLVAERKADEASGVAALRAEIDQAGLWDIAIVDGNLVMARRDPKPGSRPAFTPEVTLNVKPLAGVCDVEFVGARAQAVKSAIRFALDRVKMGFLKFAREHTGLLKEKGKGERAYLSTVRGEGRKLMKTVERARGTFVRAAIEEGERLLREEEEGGETFESAGARQMLEEAMGWLGNYFARLIPQAVKGGAGEAEKARQEEAKSAVWKDAEGGDKMVKKAATLGEVKKADDTLRRMGDFGPAQQVAASAGVQTAASRRGLNSTSRSADEAFSAAGLGRTDRAAMLNEAKDDKARTAARDAEKRAKEERSEGYAARHMRLEEPELEVDGKRVRLVSADTLNGATAVQAFARVKPADEQNPPYAVIIVPSGTLPQTEEERRKMAADLIRLYAPGAQSPQKPLVAYFDGFEKGHYTGNDGAPYDYRFRNLILIDAESADSLRYGLEKLIAGSREPGGMSQAALEEEFKALSQEGPASVIRDANGNFHLVIKTSDGVTLVKFIGPTVPAELDRNVSAIAGHLDGTDSGDRSAGFIPEQYELKPDGLYMNGERVVSLDIAVLREGGALREVVSREEPKRWYDKLQDFLERVFTKPVYNFYLYRLGGARLAGWFEGVKRDSQAGWTKTWRYRQYTKLRGFWRTALTPLLQPPAVSLAYIIAKPPALAAGLVAGIPLVVPAIGKWAQTKAGPWLKKLWEKMLRRESRADVGDMLAGLPRAVRGYDRSAAPLDAKAVIGSAVALAGAALTDNDINNLAADLGAISPSARQSEIFTLLQDFRTKSGDEKMKAAVKLIARLLAHAAFDRESTTLVFGDAYGTLGMVLSEMARAEPDAARAKKLWASAYNYLNLAVYFSPKSVSALAMRGLALLALGREAEAKKDLEKAANGYLGAELHDNVYVALGSLYEKDDPEKALGFYERVTAPKPAVPKPAVPKPAVGKVEVDINAKMAELVKAIETKKKAPKPEKAAPEAKEGFSLKKMMSSVAGGRARIVIAATLTVGIVAVVLFVPGVREVMLVNMVEWLTAHMGTGIIGFVQKGLVLSLQKIAEGGIGALALGASSVSFTAASLIEPVAKGIGRLWSRAKGYITSPLRYRNLTREARESARLDPDRIAGRIRLFDRLSSLGFGKEAARELRRMLRRFAGDSASLRMLGVYFIEEKKDAREALKVYEALTAKFGYENNDALTLKARIIRAAEGKVGASDILRPGDFADMKKAAEAAAAQAGLAAEAEPDVDGTPEAEEALAGARSKREAVEKLGNEGAVQTAQAGTLKPKPAEPDKIYEGNDEYFRQEVRRLKERLRWRYGLSRDQKREVYAELGYAHFRLGQFGKAYSYYGKAGDKASELLRALCLVKLIGPARWYQVWLWPGLRRIALGRAAAAIERSKSMFTSVTDRNKALAAWIRAAIMSRDTDAAVAAWRGLQYRKDPKTDAERAENELIMAGLEAIASRRRLPAAQEFLNWAAASGIAPDSPIIKSIVEKSVPKAAAREDKKIERARNEARDAEKASEGARNWRLGRLDARIRARNREIASRAKSAIAAYAGLLAEANESAEASTFALGKLEADIRAFASASEALGDLQPDTVGDALAALGFPRDTKDAGQLIAAHLLLGIIVERNLGRGEVDRAPPAYCMFFNSLKARLLDKLFDLYGNTDDPVVKARIMRMAGDILEKSESLYAKVSRGGKDFWRPRRRPARQTVEVQRRRIEYVTGLPGRQGADAGYNGLLNRLRLRRAQALLGDALRLEGAKKPGAAGRRKQALADLENVKKSCRDMLASGRLTGAEAAGVERDLEEALKSVVGGATAALIMGFIRARLDPSKTPDPSAVTGLLNSLDLNDINEAGALDKLLQTGGISREEALAAIDGSALKPEARLAKLISLPLTADRSENAALLDAILKSLKAVPKAERVPAVMGELRNKIQSIRDDEELVARKLNILLALDGASVKAPLVDIFKGVEEDAEDNVSAKFVEYAWKRVLAAQKLLAAGKPEEALAILTGSGKPGDEGIAGRVNAMIKAEIDKRRKGEEADGIALDVMKLATEIADLTYKAQHKLGLYYEAEMSRGRGELVLAEYEITVNGISGIDKANEHKENALAHFRRAAILDPNTPAVELALMDAHAVLHNAATGLRKALESAAESKTREVGRIKEEIDKLNSDIAAEEKRGNDMGITQEDTAAEPAAAVGQDDGAAAAVVKAAREAHQAALRSLGEKLREKETSRNALVAESDKLRNAAHEAQDLADFAKPKDIEEAVQRALRVMSASKFNEKDEGHKKAIAFLASLPEGYDTYVSMRIRALEAEAARMKEADRRKREAFLRSMRLYIRHRGEPRELLWAVRQIRQTDTDLLKYISEILNHIIGQMPEERKKDLVAALLDLSRRLNGLDRLIVEEKLVTLAMDVAGVSKDKDLADGPLYDGASPEADIARRVSVRLEEAGLGAALPGLADLIRDHLIIMHNRAVDARGKDGKVPSWQDMGEAARVELLMKETVELDDAERTAMREAYYVSRAEDADDAVRNDALSKLLEIESSRPAVDYEKVDALADKLLASDPRSEWGNYYKALALYRTDDPAKAWRLEAMRLAKKALGANKDNDKARELLVGMNEAQYEDYHPEMTGASAIHAKFFAEQARYYRDRYRKDRERSPEKAVKALDEALRLADLAAKALPRSGQIAVLKGSILIDAGRLDEAESILRDVAAARGATRFDRVTFSFILPRLIVSRADAKDAIIGLATIRYRRGLYGRADDILMSRFAPRFMTRAYGKSPDFHFRQGMIFLRTGRTAAGIRQLNRAKRLASGAAYADTADIAEAVDLLLSIGTYAAISAAIELSSDLPDKKAVARLYLARSKVAAPRAVTAAELKADLKRRREDLAAAAKADAMYAYESAARGETLDAGAAVDAERERAAHESVNGASPSSRALEASIKFDLLADSLARYDEAVTALEKERKTADPARRTAIDGQIAAADIAIGDILAKMSALGSEKGLSLSKNSMAMAARRLAREAESTNQDADRLRLYEKAVSADPENGRALLGYARALQAMEAASDLAIAELLDRAVMKDPSLDTASQDIAREAHRLYVKYGETSKAAKLLERIKARMLKADSAVLSDNAKGFDALAEEAEAIVGRQAELTAAERSAADDTAFMARHSASFRGRTGAHEGNFKSNLAGVNSAKLGVRRTAVTSKSDRFKSTLSADTGPAVMSRLLDKAAAMKPDERIAWLEALEKLYVASALPESGPMPARLRLALAAAYAKKGPAAKSAFAGQRALAEAAIRGIDARSDGVDVKTGALADYARLLLNTEDPGRFAAAMDIFADAFILLEREPSGKLTHPERDAALARRLLALYVDIARAAADEKPAAKVDLSDAPIIAQIAASAEEASSLLGIAKGDPSLFIGVADTLISKDGPLDTAARKAVAGSIPQMLRDMKVPDIRAPDVSSFIGRIRALAEGFNDPAALKAIDAAVFEGLGRLGGIRGPYYRLRARMKGAPKAPAGEAEAKPYGRIALARERLLHPKTYGERDARRSIGILKKKLDKTEAAAQNSIRTELVRLYDELFRQIRDRKYRNRARAWPSLREELASVKAAVGRLHMQLGDYAAAKREFDIAFKYDPSNAEALKGRDELESGTDADSAINNARAHIAAGEFDKARRALDRAAALDAGKWKSAPIEAARSSLRDAEEARGTFTDRLIWGAYKSEYEELNDGNDADLRKRDAILRRAASELSPAGKKLLGERTALLDEWAGRKATPLTPQQKAVIIRGITETTLVEFAQAQPAAATPAPQVLLKMADSFLAGGRNLQAFVVYNHVRQSQASDQAQKDKARFGMIECYVRSGEVEKNRTEAEKIFGEFADGPAKYAAARAIAVWYASIAAGKDADDEDEAKEAAEFRTAAEEKFKMAIGDAANGAAVGEYADFLGRDRFDRIFAGFGLSHVKAVIARTDDAKVIARAFRDALSGRMTPEKLDLIKAALARARDANFMAAAGETGLLGILSALEETLRASPLDRAGAAALSAEISATLSSIEGFAAADDVYKENPAFRAYSELIKGHISALSGDRKAALASFARAYKLDQSKEGEALLGIVLTEARAGGSVQTAREALVSLASMGSGLTPAARMAMARMLFDRAAPERNTGRKAAFLREAVAAWPEYLEAHRELQSIYARLGESYSRARETEVVKRLERSGVREPSAAEALAYPGRAAEALVYAPGGETVRYFAAPLVVAWLAWSVASVYFGVDPSAFRTLWQWSQWLGAGVFMLRHIERGLAPSRGSFRAYIAPAIVTAGSVAASLFITAPLMYIASVLALHMAVNLAVLAANRAAPFRILGFRMAAIQRAAPAAAQRKAVTIGIVGSVTGEALERLSYKYPGTEFMLISASGPEAKRELSERSAAPVQILLDVGDVDTGEVGRIVIAAYEMALRDSSISNLSLDNIFDMIIAILPEARSMDLDNILFAAFAGRAAPEGYAGEVFDPANEKAWIKDYVRALDGAADDPALSAAKDSMQYALAAYLKGKSPSEIRGLLARHAAIASALYWEEKGDGMSRAMLGEVLAGKDDGKLSVEVYDEALLGARGRRDLEGLVAADPSKGRRFKAVVVGDREGFERGITYVKRAPGIGIVSQVAAKFRTADGAAAIRNISVHLMRTPYEPMDDIAADLAANRDKAVSYVVSDSPSGELDANIVKINTAALLRAASTGKSSLVAMGNYTYRSFDGIMSVLRDLRILPMIVKVSDAIVEIFAAMKAAAISA